jgi:hypothetical protein
LTGLCLPNAGIFESPAVSRRQAVKPIRVCSEWNLAPPHRQRGDLEPVPQGPDVFGAVDIIKRELGDGHPDWASLQDRRLEKSMGEYDRTRQPLDWDHSAVGEASA